MGSRPVLLLTARDPATAYAYLNLLPAARLENRFSLKIVAQSPALEILQNSGEKVESELHVYPEILGRDSALSGAREIIDKFSPDLILTGISGPGYGIDEAVLSIAQERGLPRYALQSYWGDLNESLPGRPDTIFVIDDEAASLTVDRIECRTAVVGSLKHEGYGQLDVSKLRGDFRLNVELEPDEALIGFYGQPLEHLEGYFETITRTAEELAEFDQKFKLLYRPHPKESVSLRERTIKVFQRTGLDLILDSEVTVEPGLSGCDLVLSAFSTCGFDAQQLNRVSPVPLNITVYLLFNRQLASWFEEYTKLQRVPTVDQGIAYQVGVVGEINSVLSQLLNLKVKSAVWQGIQETLLEPRRVSRRVLDTMFDDWMFRGSSRVHGSMNDKDLAKR
jgi:hypothetical protein